MLPESALPPELSAHPCSIPVYSRSFGSWRLSVDRSPFEPEVLAAYYDRKSRDWHHVIDRHGFELAYKQLIERVMRQPRYRQDKGALRVLDAGIGTGAMSSALCEYIGNPFQLDGIDISPAMLRQAELRLEHRGIDFTLKRANLATLPYPDSTFDVVLVAHVIEHLPNPQLALDEMYRVLKPGGILICSVTRVSLLGAYVQLIWRTHQVSLTKALRWFRGSGLKSVRAIPFDKRSVARRFSLGYVGRKPTFTQNR